MFKKDIIEESKKKEKIYMAVTADEMELPVAVSSSLKDIARYLECPLSTIYPVVASGRKYKGCKVHRLYV